MCGERFRDRAGQASGVRFIPACAGNALANPAASSQLPVHPRVCGERNVGRWRVHLGCGSSPRVRGTHRGFRPEPAVDRFIPACAGNASRCGTDSRRFAVHPRVCGERRCRIRNACGFLGSSPRVRGTPVLPKTAGRHGRFIPACAGNARRDAARGCRLPVHPRVCGERTGRALTRLI